MKSINLFTGLTTIKPNCIIGINNKPTGCIPGMGVV
jgi:hypothetical protein